MSTVYRQLLIAVISSNDHIHLINDRFCNWRTVYFSQILSIQHYKQIILYKLKFQKLFISKRSRKLSAQILIAHYYVVQLHHSCQIVELQR